MLPVSRRSVESLLGAGLARGVKIGRNWRILGRDLLQLPSADEITDAELTRSLMHMSKPAFMKVWDNDEDYVMTTCEGWHLVLLPFPYTDHVGVKHR